METTNYISVTDTAKLIRQELKLKFPNCKFSVTSSKYAGGASIRIEYMDYLPESEIEKVTDRFKGAEFDSSQDLKKYVHTLEVTPSGSLNKTHYMADYIFVERNYSALYNYYLCQGLDMRTKPSLISQLENLYHLLQTYTGNNVVSLKRWDGDTHRIYYLSFIGRTNDYMVEESVRLLKDQGYQVTLTNGSGPETSFEIEVEDNEN